jgi:hypothetical protein
MFIDSFVLNTDGMAAFLNVRPTFLIAECDNTYLDLSFEALPTLAKTLLDGL